MFNNISIELIKTFSAAEIKNFEEYIKCPLFNKRKELVKLYGLIIKCRPEFTSHDLKRENLFRKLYPETEYNEQTLRTRMTELSSLIRGYFTLVYQQKNPLVNKTLQIKELMARHKYSVSEKILKEALESLEKEKYENPKYFEYKYLLLSDLCLVYSAVENYKERLNAEIKRAECFIDFFLTDFLSNAKDIITLNVHNKVSKDSDVVRRFLENFSMDPFLLYLKESDYEHYAVIAIYYYTYLTRKENDNEKHYYDLKEIVFSEYGKFSKKDQFKFWDFLSGAVYPVLVSRDRKFYDEKFQVDKFFSGLDAFLTINDKYMYAQTFNNVFAGAALVNELEWAEEFILKNKNMLLPEIRENTFNYCMAMLCSKKKEFERSLSYLGKIRFQELSYNLDVRMSYIMNYYELSIFDQLFSSIDSFKHFISENNNLPEHRIDWAKTSLTFITKIANAKSGNKNLDYAELKKAENTVTFMNRKWILEKMKELLDK